MVQANPHFLMPSVEIFLQIPVLSNWMAEDITFTPQHARARSIGRLYQDPMRGTAPGMTIEENLALAAGKGGWLSHVTHQEKERFHEELKLLDIGLEARMSQPVRTSFRRTETGTDSSDGHHEPT